MRPIKFRGKRANTGEWVYGYFAIDSMNIPAIFDPSNKMWVETDPATVGQFTGLLDKNGAEIYEGDILIMPDTEPFVVVYDDGGFITLNGQQYAFFRDGSHYSSADYYRAPEIGTIYYEHGLLPEWKVVGNIHDNPEMMEGD